MTDEDNDPRANARRLAATFAMNGDSTGWFDALYREAAGDNGKISWADMEPNPFFRRWAERSNLKGDRRKALVIGCGLGDDARYLHDLGFAVTAFDISPTAVEWSKKLHADSDIRFECSDLFQPDRLWLGAYEFVLDVYTIQALPIEMRPNVIDAITAFVGEGGSLVIVGLGRDDDEELAEVPWALSKKDLSRFGENGLTQTSFVEMRDDGEQVLVRRFVVEYLREPQS